MKDENKGTSDKILDKFLEKIDKLDNLDKLGNIESSLSGIDHKLSGIKQNFSTLDLKYGHFKDLLMVATGLLGCILVALIFV